jgi:Domain of unknown function (DUF932)
MKETKLSRDEQTVFAEAALVARYGEDESPVGPDQIIAPRRREDVGQSLWLTLNAAQENLIRGGLHGRRQTTDGRIRRAQTRAINGIDQKCRPQPRALDAGRGHAAPEICLTRNAGEPDKASRLLPRAEKFLPVHTRTGKGSAG